MGYRLKDDGSLEIVDDDEATKTPTYKLNADGSLEIVEEPSKPAPQTYTTTSSGYSGSSSSYTSTSSSYSGNYSSGNRSTTTNSYTSTNNYYSTNRRSRSYRRTSLFEKIFKSKIFYFIICILTVASSVFMPYASIAQQMVMSVGLCALAVLFTVSIVLADSDGWYICYFAVMAAVPLISAALLIFGVELPITYFILHAAVIVSTVVCLARMISEYDETAASYTFFVIGIILNAAVIFALFFMYFSFIAAQIITGVGLCALAVLFTVLAASVSSEGGYIFYFAGMAAVPLISAALLIFGVELPITYFILHAAVIVSTVVSLFDMISECEETAASYTLFGIGIILNAAVIFALSFMYFSFIAAQIIMGVGLCALAVIFTIAIASASSEGGYIFYFAVMALLPVISLALLIFGVELPVTYFILHAAVIVSTAVCLMHMISEYDGTTASYTLFGIGIILNAAVIFALSFMYFSFIAAQIITGVGLCALAVLFTVAIASASSEGGYIFYFAVMALLPVISLVLLVFWVNLPITYFMIHAAVIISSVICLFNMISEYEETAASYTLFVIGIILNAAVISACSFLYFSLVAAQIITGIMAATVAVTLVVWFLSDSVELGATIIITISSLAFVGSLMVFNMSLPYLAIILALVFASASVFMLYVGVLECDIDSVGGIAVGIGAFMGNFLSFPIFIGIAFSPMAGYIAAAALFAAYILFTLITCIRSDDEDLYVVHFVIGLTMLAAFAIASFFVPMALTLYFAVALLISDIIAHVCMVNTYNDDTLKITLSIITMIGCVGLGALAILL